MTRPVKLISSRKIFGSVIISLLTVFVGSAFAGAPSPVTDFSLAISSPIDKIISAAVTDTVYPATSTEASAKIIGEVIVRGLRRPAAAIGVYLISDLFESDAITGPDGEFVLDNIPPGKYKVSASGVNYQPYNTEEELAAGELLEVRYYIDPVLSSPYEVLVAEKRNRTEISRTTLHAEELKEIPGTQGDAIRALQALPGVTSGADFSTDLVVRGSSPDTNAFYYNRIPVGYVSHFGAIKGIFNSDSIETIDFVAGGFGPRYGGVDGGVVEITTRPGRSDRFGGFIDVSLLMTESLVEGPITDEITYMVSGRRSYLDYTLGPLISEQGVEKTVFPVFWDYQASLEYNPKVAGTKVGVYVLGADDSFSFYNESDEGAEDEEDQRFNMKAGMHSAGVNIDTDFGAAVRNELTPFYRYDMMKIKMGVIDPQWADLKIHLLGVRDDFYFEVNDSNLFSAGAELVYGLIDLDFNFVEGQKDDYALNDERIKYKGEIRGAGFALYFQDEQTLFEQLTLSIGGRLGLDGFGGELSIAPRLAARWQAAEKSLISINYGRYHLSSIIESMPEFGGNPELRAAVSSHYVIGFEQSITDALTLELQAYYKSISGMPSEDDNGVLQNQGEARMFGGEIFIRHQPVDRFFGWIAFSYGKSYRRGSARENFHESEYDRPIVCQIIAGYKITRSFKISSRWMYFSGVNYTPVDGAKYDVDANAWIPKIGEENSERMPPFHRLDSKISYTFIFNTWMFEIYNEFINMYYNTENVQDVYYNEDYSEIGYYRVFNYLVPSIGFKAFF